MPVHIIGEKNPECPLCNKPFDFQEYIGNQFYVCHKDKVAIMVDDPMVGVWNKHKDLESGLEIECANPKCKEKMNMFCRSDGFMKAVCPNPRCGAEVSTEEMADGSYVVSPGEGTDVLKDGS